jgi:D-lactate dehydrogenase (cytochrome)
MSLDERFLSDLPLADDQINRGRSALANHAADWGTEDSPTAMEPAVVVFPESTADVSSVLAGAHDHEVPVTPYAAGTGVEGGATPVDGGISLDLTRMDAIEAVRPEDFQIDVQPGVMGTAVDDAVDGHGLFFPPLPSSGDISTIGGMIATDASGMQTVKYGEVADWVLELEVVLADGTVLETGSKAVKTSSGYNLTDIFVGSEGTLGVITRATLELAPRPDQIRGGRAVFPTLEAATGALMDAVQSGVDVAKIELLDPLSAEIANEYSNTDLPDSPLIFVEFHANYCIEQEIEFCRSIFEDHGVDRFELAAGTKMDRLWEARADLGHALESFDPTLSIYHTGDVTVPIGAYDALLREIKAIADDQDVIVPCFGHGGDGNVHYVPLVDPDDEAAIERAETVYRRVVETAIDMGGTATGEHGIGLGKREFLTAEHGRASVDLMARLKEAVDPEHVLNPGTVLPDPPTDGGD